MARWRELLTDPDARLAWRRYWIRDVIFGAFDFLLIHGLRLTPIGFASALGAALGGLNGKYRFRAWNAQARANLARLRPELSPAEIDAAMARMWDNLGRAMTEISGLAALGRQAMRPHGRVRVEGAAHLQAARAGGRPVVVIGLHLGNWEVIGPVLAQLGYDPHVIYQPPRNRFQHGIAVGARKRAGMHMIFPNRAGARQAHQHLVRDRGVLLIYVDELKHDVVQAPLLGRRAHGRGNIANALRLAAASGAAIVPAHVERIEGARFRVIFHPQLALPETGAEAMLDALVEGIVRAHLEQWLMLHRLRLD